MAIVISFKIPYTVRPLPLSKGRLFLRLDREAKRLKVEILSFCRRIFTLEQINNDSYPDDKSGKGQPHDGV